MSKYKRVLLKISGEALMGQREYGLDPSMLSRIASEVKSAFSNGTEICLVIGGGNIFRGLSGAANGMERTTADYMGMLATVMNALGMQSALEEQGINTRVLSAIPMQTVCEPYIRRRAVRHMEKGRVVIFAGGTGNPFFTTDTAAALRASEMDCDAIFKGTNVDGVYDSDPKINKDAKKIDELSYLDVISKNLRVMDLSAVQSIKNDDPVWFGCDVGKYLHRSHGVMDTDLFDFDLFYGTKFTMDKATRLEYGESKMTHA